MTITLAPPECRHSAAALAVFDEIDSRVVDVFANIHGWRGWKFISNRHAPKPQSLALAREIMDFIGWYQAHRAEACLTLANRLEANEAEIVRALCDDTADRRPGAEDDHASLLGQPLTPACFAVAAVHGRIAETDDGLGLIGADYLFEQLTALITQAAQPISEARDRPNDGMSLAIKRAASNAGRANLARQLILDVATRSPESAKAMLRGLDCFRVVYPLPVWDEAYERALRSDHMLWPSRR
ncbi:hypothetical protein [Phreatobacter stygius]|uniref:Uncharacterized protein n=1 Tax=Phreatobacter stygius TaxID=1940610 RepID=A0A4D7AZI2_9HYPH|nr:hypothetical protein [Phreatobacter stygius]QCI66759.1 hypothetical protein E8M01_22465 [Phreatobacter stygius]